MNRNWGVARKCISTKTTFINILKARGRLRLSYFREKQHQNYPVIVGEEFEI